MTPRFRLLLFSPLVFAAALPLQGHAENPPALAPEALKHAEEKANALSLNDCIRLALRQRVELLSAGHDTQNAADQVRQIKSAVAPSVRFDASYSHRNNQFSSNFGGVTRGFGDKTVPSGKVTLAVPLHDFDGTPNRIDQAKHLEQASLFTQAKIRLDLAFEVTQNYLDLLEAGRQLTVVGEAIRVIEEQRRISQDFFEQGLVAKNDVLAVEVRLAERQQERIRVSNNIDLARASLNRAMGLPPTRPTVVADVSAPGQQLDDLEKLFKKALGGRPELKSMLSQQQAAQAALRAGVADQQPKIGAITEFNYSGDNTQANHTWLLGALVVQWPMFDSGLTKTRQRVRRRQTEDLGSQQKQFQNLVLLEVQRAYLNTHEALDRLPVAEKAVAAAAESLRVIRDQYAQGLVSSADVLSEEERLERARQQQHGALYDYHRGLAQLRRALGQTP